MNQMRGLRGLNYGDYSYIENFIQDGGTRFPVPNVPRRQQFFSIWIRPVPHEKAHFALRQALRELHLLVDEGISQEDFETTRDFLLNYTKLLVQTTSRRLGYAMDSRFYGTDFFVDEVQERLVALTVNEVNAAIRRHLQYDDLAIAIVTPDAHAFRDALLSTAPSPSHLQHRRQRRDSRRTRRSAPFRWRSIRSDTGRARGGNVQVTGWGEELGTGN